MRRPRLWERLVAAGHDYLTTGLEREVFGPRRRELLSQASGRVLDVGAGTGANLPHFPWLSGQMAELVLLDPSAGMLERALGIQTSSDSPSSSLTGELSNCRLRTPPLIRWCSR